MRIAEKVKEFFHNEGIHSTTIQPEFVEVYVRDYTDERMFFFRTIFINFFSYLQQYPDANNLDCFLSCPEAADVQGPGCAASTCCGPQRLNLMDACGDVPPPNEGDLLIQGSNAC
jgi:hypothetical protein